MTKIKNLSDRVCKISISLDCELVNYLDELEESRSEIIKRAIVDFRTKQRQIIYARILREKIKCMARDS
jgi:metal-responsive CopG/Arc/MetJ family transcriptional regulator